MASRIVQGKFAYLQRLELYEHEKPYQVYIPMPKDAVDPRSTNLEFEDVETEICDARANQSSFSLDSHGFQFVNWPMQMPWQSLRESEIVVDKYFGEIERLLRNALGDFDRIFFFDWRLRSSDTREGPTEIDMNDKTVYLDPAPRVHVDQSPNAVVHRVRLQLGDDAEFLLRGRVRIVNAWRPIGHEVQDWPLAVCDAKTIDRRDMVPTDHVRRNFKGETMYLHHNEEQKWYYLSQQRPEEVLLMKMFDSDAGVQANFCPHASFRDTSLEGPLLPRRSIETRALIFNYPKSEKMWTQDDQ